MAPHAGATATCPPKGPVAANSRVTVVYDPADSSMKACVAGSWLALSGGGGGGGPLDGLTDVTISSPALNHVLLYNGGAWVNAPVTVSEADPQVGTLTANKWCAANAGATAIDCTQDAPSGGSTSSGSAGYVQFSGGSGAFASDSNLVWDNTNKGLGVGRAVGPSETAVLRNAAGKGVMIGGGTTGNDGTTALYVHANAAAQYGLIVRPAASATAPVLDIQTNDGSSSMLTVSPTGNVGIGTASPGFHLSAISGPAEVTANRHGLLVQTSSDSVNSAPIRFYKSRGSPSGPTAVLAGDLMMNLAAFGYDSTAFSNQASIVADAAENWTTTAKGSQLRFNVTPTGAASFIEAMRIAANGNIGIGTTSPTEKLEVSGKVKATEFCNASGTCIDIASVPTLPAGAIMAFDLTTCPTGWSEYTAARGRFLRGIDNGAGVDPAGTRAPGNLQADDWKSFSLRGTQNSASYAHEVYMAKNVGSYAGTYFFGGYWSNPNSGIQVNWDSSEIRPKNVAVLYCRKN